MHCLLSSFGSADTQRGDDAVSGSRMPTLVFFGAAVEPEVPPLLPPQPARPARSRAAVPVSAKIARGVVRIGALPSWSRHWDGCGTVMALAGRSGGDRCRGHSAIALM